MIKDHIIINLGMIDQTEPISGNEMTDSESHSTCELLLRPLIQLSTTLYVLEIQKNLMAFVESTSHNSYIINILV